MPKRLKVLISAYACEPGKGTEPEVGWRWVLEMAKHHDVTVLTHLCNKKNIEKEIGVMRGRQPVPKFVYHEEGPFLTWIQKRFKAVRIYYTFWHRTASKIIARLQKKESFDLMQHITITGFRFRTAIWGHGVPTIWGPIGGIESIPWQLLPWRFPSTMPFEFFRYFNNLIQFAPGYLLARRAKRTTIILVSTRQMQQTLLRYGFESTVMPAIAFDAGKITPPERQAPKGPLKVLYVGNLLLIKGIDLVIESVAASKTDAQLTIVGDGKLMGAMKELAADLGIGDRVDFRGRLPFAETLQIYQHFDLFIFPSLADTGGFALIEAMSWGLPAICLDCGGPQLAVEQGAGIRVSQGARAEVVEGLGNAIRFYDHNRDKLIQHGLAARQSVLRNYDWAQRGRDLDVIYWKAVAKAAPETTELTSHVPQKEGSAAN